MENINSWKTRLHESTDLSFEDLKAIKRVTWYADNYRTSPAGKNIVKIGVHEETFELSMLGSFQIFRCVVSWAAETEYQYVFDDGNFFLAENESSTEDWDDA